MQVIQSIQNRIYEIRGGRVMLDFDLAALYEVETKALNQAVKRNIERFPADFMFRLTPGEWSEIRSQIVTTLSQNTQYQLVGDQLNRGFRVFPLCFYRTGSCHA